MIESNRTFVATSIIEIYGDQNLENLLLRLPTTTTVTWREVFLILFDALNGPLTSDAALFKAVLETSVQNRTNWQVSFQKIVVAAPGIPISSGRYVLCPSGSTTFEVVNDVHLLSAPSSTSGSRTGSRAGSPSLFSLNQDRSHDFAKKVMNRDKRCIISNVVAKFCHACHIIPLRCKQELLPSTISNTLLKIDKGLNNVRNGVVLKADLRKGYDELAISVKPVRNGYYVIVFDKDTPFNQYNLKRLDPRWNDSTGPVPEFLKYHCSLCLAKCLRGEAYQANDYYDSDDEKEVQ